MPSRQGLQGGDEEAPRGPGNLQPDRDHDPAPARGRGAGCGGNDPTGADELRSLEERDEEVRRSAEHLARLAEEKELFDELAKDNFEGPGWERLAEVLARYGRAVIFAWLVTGEMFTKATQRGRGVGPKPANFCRDDCEELAQEILIFGIRHFRRYCLKERQWNPAKGASMNTYFVGGCIGEFSNAYDSWLRHRGGDVPTPADPQILAEYGDRNELDPADEIVYAEAIISVFESLTGEEQEIISLYRSGYSHEEIADILGLTSREAVAERVRRILERIKKMTNRPDQGTEGA